MRFLHLAAGLLALAAMTAGASARPEVTRLVDDHLARLSADGFAGVVLVAVDGQVVLRRGYGVADRDRGVANRPDTIHAIGSVAKTFTQLAVAALAREGGLTLESTLGELLPEVPEDKTGITVAQLLNHRSGLPHALGGDPFEMLTRDEALARILASPLAFAPGTGQLYSNPGYTLLAILVELRSGVSYRAYVRARILDPAGMRSTFFYGDAPRGRQVAAYTNTRDGYGTAAAWPASWKLQGAGNMLSTVDDLYAFHRWMLRDPLALSVMDPRGGVGLAGGATFASLGADYEYLPAHEGAPPVVVIALTNGDRHGAEEVVLDSGLLRMVLESLGVRLTEGEES